MEKSNFDRLLQRYLDGKVSEQERIKIEAWLDVRKTEEKAETDLSREDEEKLFLRITAGREITDPSLSSLRKPYWAVRIAAGLLILLSITYIGWYVTARSTNTEVANAGVQKMILNDGSIVWLKGASSLTYFERPDGGRQASLAGEALFEVAKDGNRPFRIICGDITIRVVGTSFIAKTGDNKLELAVLTGKVHLSSATDSLGVDVGQNEKVVYTTTGKSEGLSQEIPEHVQLIESTEYNMQFRNTALDQVVERIARKFNVAVKLEEQEAGKCRITADFTDHSLESTLEMISEVLDVTYRKDGKTVWISGSGCK